MNQYEISASTLPHSYFAHVDTNPEYSYAYCEPIVTKLNKSIPDKMGSPTGISTSISSNALSKGPSAHSLRALLTKSFRKNSAAPGTERHTFTTRYGTKENIYEDVGAGTIATRRSQSSESINKVPVEEELKFVQKQHDRIMGELNLSIEALLMPSQDETELMERRAEEQQHIADSCMDEHRFSPTQIPMHILSSSHADFDSGISGSSSSGASYSGSMRQYRSSHMFPPRNLTIYEAPSTSSSSSQLTRPQPPDHPPPPPMLPGKISCCFYGTPNNCPECHPVARVDPNLEPIESISEKVNFWNKIGKIKGVFNVPGSPKQQSPVDGKKY